MYPNTLLCEQRSHVHPRPIVLRSYANYIAHINLQRVVTKNVQSGIEKNSTEWTLVN